MFGSLYWILLTNNVNRFYWKFLCLLDRVYDDIFISRGHNEEALTYTKRKRRYEECRKEGQIDEFHWKAYFELLSPNVSEDKDEKDNEEGSEECPILPEGITDKNNKEQEVAWA